MFKSESQIDYFVSNNPTERTLNHPLNLEVKTCTWTNNKYYYILNYNKAERKRIILYLDFVFGNVKKARIADEIYSEKWDDLIQKYMVDINNYQMALSNKSKHIDVIEIESNTPILSNVYYNYEEQIFSGLKLGDIAIKNLALQESTSITLNATLSNSILEENPNRIFRLVNGEEYNITEYSLQKGFLFNIPESISIINNSDTPTRFIFKLGYIVESQ